MDPVLIDSNHFYLRNHNTNQTIPSTFTISTDFTTVYITPTVELASTTIYDVVVSNPYWCLTNIAGNNINNCGLQVVSSFTTGTAAAVNGLCGTANGSSFSSAPAANLCSAGTASAVTNPGSWTWTCNGQNGGTNASCSATVAGGPACYVPAAAASMVGWWRGNDDATDHVGGNNGTLENGAGFALGETGDAFSFNGNDQYVLIGQPVPANLQLQNAFTLSAWIYVTSYPANVGSGPYQAIVGTEEGTNHAGIAIYLDGTTGYPIPPGSIDLDIGSGTSWYSVLTTTQIPLNQWVLVTATANANQPPSIYYNGVVQPQITPAGEAVWNGTVSYSGSSFTIGQTLPANYSFNGLIDDVQVYSSALSQTDVQGIYNAGGTGVCP